MTILDSFPKRSIKFTRPQGRWFSFIAIILILMGVVGILESYEAIPILVDDFGFGSGELAIDAATSAVNCTSRTIIQLTNCEFEVAYKLADGSVLKKHVKYVSAFSQVDVESPFEIWYNPAAPEHVSTTWGRSMRVNRSLTQAFLTAGSVCFFLGGLVWQISGICEKRKYRALRSNFPVVAAYDPTSQPMPVPNARVLQFAWTDPHTQLTHKDSTVFDSTKEPFWLNRERTKILVIASSSGHAHALDQSLRDLILTSEERAAIDRARSQFERHFSV